MHVCRQLEPPSHAAGVCSMEVSAERAYCRRGPADDGAHWQPRGHRHFPLFVVELNVVVSPLRYRIELKLWGRITADMGRLVTLRFALMSTPQTLFSSGFCTQNPF